MKLELEVLIMLEEGNCYTHYNAGVSIIHPFYEGTRMRGFGVLVWD